MCTDRDRIELVIQRDLDWARAHLELDLETIHEILAEDYQQIRQDGSRIGKADLVASYRSGERRWEIARSYDHRVKLSGDLAIVLGRWRGKGINQGERFDYSARFISIYRWENETWKMILDRSVAEP